MSPHPNRDVASAIAAVLGRDERAADAVFQLLYEELRSIATRLMHGERPHHTLTPTALVHEAYLRLSDHDALREFGRERLLAVAARVMRQVLIDHARRSKAQKRGRGERVTLHDEMLELGADALDFEELHEALERLEARSPRLCRVIELRFFAGLTTTQTAEVLNVSVRTVGDDWTVARMWLARELGRGGE